MARKFLLLNINAKCSNTAFSLFNVIPLPLSYLYVFIRRSAFPLQLMFNAPNLYWMLKKQHQYSTQHIPQAQALVPGTGTGTATAQVDELNGGE